MKFSSFGVLAVVLVGAILIASAFVASCSPDTSAPSLAQITTPTEPDPHPETLFTVDDVAIEPFTDHECLDCHTDQVRLVELALPEEAVEELSDGPG